MTGEAGLDQVLAMLQQCMSSPGASSATLALVTVRDGGCYAARGVSAYLAIRPCDGPYSGTMGC
jgi:hypothetical protein